MSQRGGTPRLLSRPKPQTHAREHKGESKRIYKENITKERFDSGFDEDWPTGAPIDITVPRVAVARTTGEIGVRNGIGKGLDLHELMKKEMFESPNDYCDNHFEKNRPCPDATYGIADRYLVLDTFHMTDESRPGEGMLRWNIMIQGVTGDQVIGSRDKLDTIIEMQIMGSFCIPKIATVPYVTNAIAPYNTSLPVLTSNGGPPDETDSLASPLTQLPFCSRVTIQVQEVGLQSFSDGQGARHHFELEAHPHFYETLDDEKIDSGTLELRTRCDWDRYIFTDPIKDMHGITLIFRNPDIPISFPSSCFFGVQSQTSVVDVGHVPDPVPPNKLQFNVPNHGLVTNDRIFIRGFLSGNQVIDNYVNNEQGLLVGNSGSVADPDNTFRLNPDVDLLVLGLAQGTILVPPSSIFGIPWATGPSTATSIRQLLAFNNTDLSGNNTYSSNATFALPWATGPNAGTSARDALGFQAMDLTSNNSYTSNLPFSIPWVTGPSALISIRQILSLPLSTLR